MIWLQRLSLIAATMSLSATLLGATLPTAAGTPERASLAGQLLIASPTMGDPRFHHAVILMVRHDRNGALGIVVNRPVGERPLAALLAALGDKDTGVAGTVRIFSGGPVQPEIALIVHSADYQRSGTIDIDGQVAMSSSLEILRDIGSNRGPSKSLIAFGYAGWRPGQLEGEIGHGFWFTTPQDAKLVFDADRDQVWDDAMKRRTQDL